MAPTGDCPLSEGFGLGDERSMAASEEAGPGVVKVDATEDEVDEVGSAELRVDVDVDVDTEMVLNEVWNRDVEVWVSGLRTLVLPPLSLSPQMPVSQGLVEQHPVKAPAAQT